MCFRKCHESIYTVWRVTLFVLEAIFFFSNNLRFCASRPLFCRRHIRAPCCSPSTEQVFSGPEPPGPQPSVRSHTGPSLRQGGGNCSEHSPSQSRSTQLGSPSPSPWGHTGLCEPQLLVAPGRLPPAPITKPWATARLSERRVSVGVAPAPRYDRGQTGLQMGTTSGRVAVTAARGVCRF